jgi:hypothetical protein
MKLEEFSKLVRNGGNRKKGIDYLRSNSKRLWERPLAALACPWISPVITVQAIQLLAGDGWPLFYDLAKNNIPDEVKKALEKQGKKLNMHKVRSMMCLAEKNEARLLEETGTLGELEEGGTRESYLSGTGGGRHIWMSCRSWEMWLWVIWRW